MSPVERLYLAGLLTEAELGATVIYRMARQRNGQAGRVGLLLDQIETRLAAHGLADYGGAMMQRLCIRDELPHAVAHMLDGQVTKRGARDLDVMRTVLGLVAEVGRTLRAS